MHRGADHGGRARCRTSVLRPVRIDYDNHSADVQQATRDEMHSFYAQTPEQRRAYSEELVTNFADPLTVAWPNHAKLFFNNKGVAAHTTDICSQYPPGDPSVWSW
jgi:hypothetical protein